MHGFTEENCWHTILCKITKPLKKKSSLKPYISPLCHELCVKKFKQEKSFLPLSPHSNSLYRRSNLIVQIKLISEKKIIHLNVFQISRNCFENRQINEKKYLKF